MREITVYEARDKSRWDKQSDCLIRDAMFNEALAITEPLGVRPTLSEFQFKQHEPSAVSKARTVFETLAMKHFGTTNGRVVSDMDSPISTAMNRLDCIDEQGREWQQPYFARNTPSNPERVG